MALLAAWPACGQTISLTGSWTLSVSAADLSAGAGSDFSTPQESADTVYVSIANTTGNKTWYVRIYRVDSSWSAALTLRAIRTGTGTGSGSAPTESGPPDGLVVTDSPQVFFSGGKDRSNIPIAFRLEGLTVPLGGPATYTTTLYYTVSY